MSSEMRQVRAQDVAGLRAINYWPRAGQTVGELVDELVSQLKLPEAERQHLLTGKIGRRDADLERCRPVDALLGNWFPNGVRGSLAGSGMGSRLATAQTQEAPRRRP